MTRRWIALAAAAALLAACGGDDADPPPEATTEADTTTTALTTTTIDSATTTLETTSTSTAPNTSTAPITTLAGPATTLPPVPTTTTGPLPTTTTTPLPTTTTTPPPTTTTLPQQRISVGGPFGQRFELVSDQTVAATASLLEFDPSPVAVDTGNPVTTTLLGPDSVCSSDGRPDIFLQSSRIGDACGIRFQADAGDGFAAADYTLTLEIASAGDISWTIASGPGQFECFEPNQPIDDLVLRPQAGSIPLGFNVGVVTADGISFPFAEPDGDGVVVEFEPFPDSATGSEARFSIGYQAQGQTIYVPDEDMEFVWSVQSACP